jgi:hypothetical protein
MPENRRSFPVIERLTRNWQFGPAPIELRAKAALSNEPDAVRDFVSEVFNQSLLADAAPSLRLRVFNAELSFRRSGVPTVPEVVLVKVTNEQPNLLHFPPLFKTSADQVKAAREIRRRLLPSVLEPAEMLPNASSESMSPAEAIYVLLLIPANHWMTGMPDAREISGGEMNQPLQRKPRAVLRGRFIPERQAIVARSIERDIRDESSAVVERAHAILDALGMPR